MNEPASIRKGKRDRLTYLLLFLVSVSGAIWIAVLTFVKPYTQLEDCAKLSGTVESHSRSSEAVVRLDDGTRIFARSNQQTMNRSLASTKRGDRVTGYYLEPTHNVVELYVNGHKISGFEDYQVYEKWERQFLAGCSIVLFVCALGFAISYLSK